MSIKLPMEHMGGGKPSTGTQLTNDATAGYTCPSDGYFMIYCNNQANCYAYGYIGLKSGGRVQVMGMGTPTTTSSMGYFYQSLFVRKGAVISYVGSANNLSYAYFFPLD